MYRVDRSGAATLDELGELLDELLDAHVDTLMLADELEPAPGLGAHLDYLRSLQRVGRETLARLPQAAVRP